MLIFGYRSGLPRRRLQARNVEAAKGTHTQISHGLAERTRVRHVGFLARIVRQIRHRPLLPQSEQTPDRRKGDAFGRSYRRGARRRFVPAPRQNQPGPRTTSILRERLCRRMQKLAIRCLIDRLSLDTSEPARATDCRTMASFRPLHLFKNVY